MSLIKIKQIEGLQAELDKEINEFTIVEYTGTGLTSTGSDETWTTELNNTYVTANDTITYSDWANSNSASIFINGVLLPKADWEVSSDGSGGNKITLTTKHEISETSKITIRIEVGTAANVPEEPVKTGLIVGWAKGTLNYDGSSVDSMVDFCSENPFPWFDLLDPWVSQGGGTVSLEVSDRDAYDTIFTIHPGSATTSIESVNEFGGGIALTMSEGTINWSCLIVEAGFTAA